MSLNRQAIWSVALFLIVGVAVLGVRPLVQPDEPRYGIIAAQMARTGEWTSLQMAGFHYYEKPPMGYWAIAVSIKVLGENAFAIRLPSAIATGVAALAAGILAARITRRRELGPAAFAVQATTIGPLVIGTVASLDAMFSACIGVTLVAFHVGSTQRGVARARWLALAGVAAGFAFMTKGVLGLAIPAVTAIAWLAWERRWLDMLRLSWIPMVVAAITVAPMALAVHRSEPGFWEYFIVVEHFRRFASPDANQHSAPWWYLLVMVPIGGVMWTLTWPRVVRGLFNAPELVSGIRFAICWIVAPLLLLSLSKGKLPTYVLPLFVPVAVLVTIGLVTGYERGTRSAGWSRKMGRWILRILAALVAVAAFAPATWFGISEWWIGGAQWRLLALSAALLAWAQLDRWSWRTNNATLWLMRSATAPVLVLALIPVLFPEGKLRRTQMPWTVLEAHRAVLANCTTLMSSSQLGHCVAWVSRRDDMLIVGSPSEFDNELDIAPEKTRLLSVAGAMAMIASRKATPQSAQSIALVTSSSDAIQMLKAKGAVVPDLKVVDGDMALLAWGIGSPGQQR